MYTLKVGEKNGCMLRGGPGCFGRVPGAPDTWLLQEVLGGPQELPKEFCCFDKNFKAIKL